MEQSIYINSKHLKIQNQLLSTLHHWRAAEHCVRFQHQAKCVSSTSVSTWTTETPCKHQVWKGMLPTPSLKQFPHYFRTGNHWIPRVLYHHNLEIHLADPTSSTSHLWCYKLSTQTQQFFQNSSWAIDSSSRASSATVDCHFAAQGDSMTSGPTTSTRIQKIHWLNLIIPK